MWQWSIEFQCCSLYIKECWGHLNRWNYLQHFCVFLWTHWKSHLHSLMMGKQALHIFSLHPHCHSESVTAARTTSMHTPTSHINHYVWSHNGFIAWGHTAKPYPQQSEYLCSGTRRCWIRSAASRQPFDSSWLFTWPEDTLSWHKEQQHCLALFPSAQRLTTKSMSIHSEHTLKA